MFQKKRFAQAALGLGLAVAGSATWDFAAKPLFIWLGEATLVLGTLGLDSLRQGLYESIGRGHNEIQIVTLGFVFIIVWTFLSIMIATSMILARRHRIGAQLPSPSEMEGERSLLRRLNYVNVVFLFFGMAFSSYWFARAAYVTASISSLERYQAVIAPFVPANERLLLRSRALSIRNRGDYVDLIRDLQKIGTSHGKDFGPTFIL